ncbi:hypothetical protein BDV95DRAFT_222773 [Massariosphaeria phaeospora]|uniref:Transmembrane protein n=1 Tax=Massariosphaeria phaeospora TaxID=100035 RepID=A0A7C8IK99_9PLEO|nr:hypothetical protein BDV95DRAFT_222773 [Massariosphaeria phaeospora]
MLFISFETVWIWLYCGFWLDYCYLLLLAAPNAPGLVSHPPTTPRSRRLTLSLRAGFLVRGSVNIIIIIGFPAFGFACMHGYGVVRNLFVSVVKYLSIY